MQRKLMSVNPYSEVLNWEFDLIEEKELDEIIKTAHKAFLEWRFTASSEKKNLFLGLASELEKDIDECARLQTIEMWMLFGISKTWLKNTANLIRWFANNFEEILWEKDFESEWIKAKSLYDPLWVIFWVAPWNFPFNQLLRAAVPNIIAWNTQIYKHSSNVPMCAKKIQDLFDKAWFKKWIYTNIFVSSSLSEYIISNKYIIWVNLTGSERAWSTVWSLAWKYLKPSVLELWWNDAFVLCDTNNLDDMVDRAVKARIKNAWQACNSSKRFIVMEKHYDEFCNKFAQKMENLVVWDPMLPETELWPISSLKSVEDMEKQIQRAVDSWATLMTWWKRLNMKWYFLAPSVLKNVTTSVSSFNEEIFWPVASIIKSRDLEHSIELANSTDFWLSASVHWDDIPQLTEVAKKLDWGMIFVNNIAWSKASFPFGWIKKSWYWKENGPDWLKAFTNKKVILY